MSKKEDCVWVNVNFVPIKEKDEFEEVKLVSICGHPKETKSCFNCKFYKNKLNKKWKTFSCKACNIDVFIPHERENHQVKCKECGIELN
ncbi:MAG: hypothetical protein KAS39_04195 [Actinomycetia bacterium]|nr:hypothetical protein [Actinomycetes bacterium]